MNTYDVVVFGSINLDVVTHVKDYPHYGDSVLAKKIETIPGGKGANQAITVAKQGSQMLFISSVGKIALESKCCRIYKAMALVLIRFS